MGKKIINIDIDLSKIDKKKIRIKDNGSKYYSIAAIETPSGKYGDWMIVEKQTKEERENGEKSTILGNGKNFGWGESKPQSQSNRNDIPDWL